ncbi:MAG TPA: sensor histidine kinase [Bryobacteraceae bacterium]|nr:sensor histidine kinase [Bryobacteraceae bacterium]
MAGRSPTPRLLLGLAGTLALLAVFAIYSLRQFEGLRSLQTQTIDRNRKDSLQLLRIQNDLNSLALAMRDMVDRQDGYPLEAWRAEFKRTRFDLEDAMRLEAQLATRPAEQREYLANAIRQFWISSDQIFGIAQSGEEERARRMISNSLLAQQASLSSMVARLLVQNNAAEEQASAEIQEIYKQVELNLLLFAAAMAASISAITLWAILHNRRVFADMQRLSEQRSTLAQRLIGVQEEVFRSVARELHDDFGQILTAVGVMLGRVSKKETLQELTEVREVVQTTLEKTRSFSQALHPTILDDYGLEKAIERYVETFERQTGVPVEYRKQGTGTVPDDKSIHVYRVLQEALNNVAKHAQASKVAVSVSFDNGNMKLQVEDNGVGIPKVAGRGLGMIAMQERAELLQGHLAVQPRTHGTLVTLEVPIGSSAE